MTSQEHLKEPYLARQEEDAAIARTLDRILEARGKFADQMAEEAKAMEKIAGKAVEIAHAEVFSRSVPGGEGQPVRNGESPSGI